MLSTIQDRFHKKKQIVEQLEQTQQQLEKLQKETYYKRIFRDKRHTSYALSQEVFTRDSRKNQEKKLTYKDFRRPEC